jgi:hypothetical protein
MKVRLSVQTMSPILVGSLARTERENVRGAKRAPSWQRGSGTNHEGRYLALSYSNVFASLDDDYV